MKARNKRSAPLKQRAWLWHRAATAGPERAIWPVLLGMFLLVLAVPAGLIVLGSVAEANQHAPFQFGLSHWQTLWSDPRSHRALITTLALSSINLVLSFTLALPIAWVLARTNLPGVRWLELGFWASFFLPTLSTLQGWTFLLEGRVGLLNQWLETFGLVDTSPLNVYSFWGIVWVHLMSHDLSALVIFLVPVFRNMNPALEEAAISCGANTGQLLKRVFLPIMKPVIGVALIIAVTKGIQSFEIVRVLGSRANIHVYGTLLVETMNDPSRSMGLVNAMSSMVLLLLIPLVVLQRRLFDQQRYVTITSRAQQGRINLRGWRWLAFSFILLVVLLLTVVPCLAVIMGSIMRRWGYFSITDPWTMHHWKTVIGNDTFLQSLFTTLWVGFSASMLSVIISYLVAYCIIRTSFKGRAWLDGLTWVPTALPGVLLSLAFLLVVLRVPILKPLYGTIGLVILVVVVYRLPLTVQLLKTGLQQLDLSLEEVAHTTGSSWFQAQLHIITPLLRPMLGTIGLMTFIAAATDVSSIVLIASFETRTLSLLALDYLVSQYQREVAAVVTTMMTGMAMTAALCIHVLTRRTVP